MLNAFKHLRPTRASRYISHKTTRETVSTPSPQKPRPKLVRYPYYVPRNSRGSLPVYSDIRNNGTRILLLIRHVEGDVEKLAKDVRQALLDKDSRNATRLKVTVKSRQLVLQGGYWKNQVMEWLISKGF